MKSMQSIGFENMMGIDVRITWKENEYEMVIAEKQKGFYLFG